MHPVFFVLFFLVTRFLLLLPQTEVPVEVLLCGLILGDSSLMELHLFIEQEVQVSSVAGALGAEWHCTDLNPVLDFTAAVLDLFDRTSCSL